MFFSDNLSAGLFCVLFIPTVSLRLIF